MSGCLTVFNGMHDKADARGIHGIFDFAEQAAVESGGDADAYGPDLRS